MKVKIQSSRQLWIVSLVIFAAVAAAMLFGTYYMNISIRAEEEAQTRRAEYKQLGEDLANASDDLTAEVRSYAITGDIEPKNGDNDRGITPFFKGLLSKAEL